MNSERSCDSGSTWTTIHDADANATRYDDTGLEAASYEYRVVAYNDAGTTTSGVAYDSRPQGPPVAASNLVATANTSTGGIDLTWTDNSSNESGFIVERSYDGLPFAQETSATGTSASDSIYQIQPGEQYTYRVRSYRTYGGSLLIADPSNEVTATATVLSGAPSAPSSVSASQDPDHPGVIDLSWSDNSSGQADSEVQFKDITQPAAEDGLPAHWANYASQISTPTFTAGTTSATMWVDGNRTYEVRLRSKQDGKYSAWSSPASVTVPADHPDAPTGLTATLVSDDQYALTWQQTSPTGLGYHVTTFDGTNANSETSGSTSTTIYLTAGKTYTIQVAAYKDYVDAYNWGYRSWSSSDEISVTVPASPVPTVTVQAIDDLSKESGPGGDGINPGRFLISRGTATDQPLTVSYQIGGTASAGDYSGLTGTVTIPANAVSEIVEMDPTNDSTREWTETVTVTISDGGSSYQVSPSANTATLEIVDDDAVDISIQDLPEETQAFPNETKPGAKINVNDDDDNGNGIADDQETQIDLNDDDLEPVQLSFPSDYKTGAIVNFSLNAPQSFRIWKDDGSLVGSSFTLNPSDGPTMTVYLEAIAPGSTTMVLNATDSGTTRPSNSSDSANVAATIADLSLTVTDTTDATNTATNSGDVYVYRNAANKATVNISGDIKSGSNHSPSSTLWKVSTAGVGGALPDHGTYSAFPTTITLAPDMGANFPIRAGFDLNGDRVLNSSEILRTIVVHVIDKPVVTIKTSDHKADAYEIGPVNGEFTVTRQGDTHGPLTVQYSIDPSSTATPAADYTTLTGTVTIPANSVSAVIAVTVKPDNVAEGDETVKVNLTPASTVASHSSDYLLGANPSDRSATVTIHDNLQFDKLYLKRDVEKTTLFTAADHHGGSMGAGDTFDFKATLIGGATPSSDGYEWQVWKTTGLDAQLAQGHGANFEYQLPNDAMSLFVRIYYDSNGDQTWESGEPVIDKSFDSKTYKIYNLTVARASTTLALSNAQATAKMKQATDALSIRDTEADRRAAVRFVLNGTVSTWTPNPATTPDFINEATDTDHTNLTDNVNANIRIVRGYSGAGTLGLTAIGSDSVTVREDQDGKTWAHEWGHRLGLQHRNDDPDALMSTNRGLGSVLNDEERQIFEQ